MGLFLCRLFGYGFVSVWDCINVGFVCMGLLVYGFVYVHGVVSVWYCDLMFALKYTDPVNYADDNTLCAIANSIHEAIQKPIADGNISIDWFTHNDIQANSSKFHLWSQVVAQVN